MKLRVYMIHNLDGDNRAVVAASNQKEAARLIGCSVYAMREMGWHNLNPDEPTGVMAFSRPGIVFYKALSWESEWSTSRHHRSRGER